MLIYITEASIAWLSEASLTPMKTNSIVCAALYKMYRGMVMIGLERNLVLKMDVRVTARSQQKSEP